MFAITDAIKYGWESISTRPTARPGGYQAMREWQAEAFDQLHDEPRVILNAPMGAGKSFLVNALSASRMAADPALRTVISVPQTIISSGFTSAKIEFPSGERVYWCPHHDLTEASADSNVDALVAFLERTQTYGRSSLDDGALVCTHATLVAAYKALAASDRLGLLDDVLLWVDEAHHVQSHDRPEAEVNGLGAVVSDLLQRDRAQVSLVTASFFRGDRSRVLSVQQEAQFTRYSLTYERHLPTLDHLKSFSYSFKLCDGDYLEGVREVIESGDRKDIVYIPHPSSNASTGDKLAEARQILGYYSGDKTLLDLVDETDREAKKAFITTGLDDRDALDAVVALGMFKEGADWRWAERAVVAGARGSLVDIVQMLGRLFRDAPGKEHVELVHLLPYAFDLDDPEALRDNLNDYLKTVYASMVLDVTIIPVRIKGMASPDPLGDVLPDAGDQQRVIEGAGTVLLDMAVLEADLQSTDAQLTGDDVDKAAQLRERLQDRMPEILEAAGVPASEARAAGSDVADQVYGAFVRPTARLRGLDVSTIDFDLLADVNPLAHLVQFTTGACGADTFSKLRKAIMHNRTDAAKNDADLLAWARSGGYRPQELGAQTNRAAANDAALLELAASGAPRPQRRAA